MLNGAYIALNEARRRGLHSPEWGLNSLDLGLLNGAYIAWNEV
jgi:hypothetical protein